jgi:hypothetical protein
LIKIFANIRICLLLQSSFKNKAIFNCFIV